MVPHRLRLPALQDHITTNNIGQFLLTGLYCKKYFYLNCNIFVVKGFLVFAYLLEAANDTGVLILLRLSYADGVLKLKLSSLEPSGMGLHPWCCISLKGSWRSLKLSEEWVSLLLESDLWDSSLTLPEIYEKNGLQWYQFFNSIGHDVAVEFSFQLYNKFIMIIHNFYIAMFNSSTLNTT